MDQQTEGSELGEIEQFDQRIAAGLPWALALAADGDGMQPDGTFVLPLKDPVAWGNEKDRFVEKVTFRPANGEDLYAFGQIANLGSFPRLMELASRLTGQPLKILKGMKAHDAHRCCEVATRFFEGTTSELGGAS